MEQEKYTILRVRRETHRLLRRIAAMSDESMVSTIARLAETEWERIEKTLPAQSEQDAKLLDRD